MKKLIIFDLDGTLLNTLSDITSSINYSLELHGYEKVSEEYIRKIIGQGINTTISRCIHEINNVEVLVSSFRDYYRAHMCDKTIPYENIIDVLKSLKDQGYKLAVATNKNDAIAKELIFHFFGDSFDIIQGPDDNTPRKPDPTIFNKILNSLNISKEETLYIGDSFVDIQFATNCDVDLALVTYGFKTKEELLDKLNNKKARLINEPTDILNILKN